MPTTRNGGWLNGGGMMAGRIRDFDWSATALGAIGDWPQSLKTAVQDVLASDSPMVLLWGPQFVQIYNDGYAALMGARHPAGLGQDTRACWREIWAVNAPIYERVRAGETVNFENALHPIDRGGGIQDAWFNLSYSPVLDDAGHLSGVLVAVNETTDAVLAGRSLRESEARSHRLIEDFAQATWETDAAGLIVADSPSWRAYTGQSLEEWLDSAWIRAIHPDDRAFAEAQWREAVTSHVNLNAEFRLRHAASGGWRWTNVLATPLLAEDGTVRKWVGMNIDIDVRKRAEQSLRESEDRQAFLLKLSDALRAQPDEDGATDLAMRLLADKLDVDRCFVATMDWAAGKSSVTHQYRRPGLPEVPQVLRNADFPSAAGQVSTKTIVLHDTASEPGLSERDRQSFAAMQFGAVIGASVRRGEENPIWTMAVVSKEPRRWTDGEAALVQDVAERTWTMIERARSEASLRESEDQYRVLFNSIDEGFCTVEVLFDADQQPVDYRFLQINPAFLRQTGLVDAVGRTMLELSPDHEQHWFEIYGRIALTGEPARFESRAASLGRWYDVYAFRVGDPQDRHVAVLFRDILERKRAEAALRASEERFRLIVENASDYAIFIVGPDGIITDWHEGAEAVFRYTSEEIIGQPFDVLFTPDDRDNGVPAEELRIAAAKGKADNIRWHVRKDGSRVFIEGVVTALRDQEGGLAGFLKIGRDATQKHAADERQSLLRDELQHRVRNTIGMVRSIARRTAEGSATVGEYARHLEGRIAALARTQTLLTREPGSGVNLSTLILDELLVQAPAEDRLTMEGKDVRLSSKAAEVVTLAIHELATNAVKYGSLSTPHGRVDVRWTEELRDGDPWLSLIWTEQGGPYAPAPVKTGFGTELILHRVPYELNGDAGLDYSAGTLKARISFPLVEGDSILQTHDRIG